MEIWKSVELDDFSDIYEVSSHGRVRNLKTRKVLKPIKHNVTGYLQVGLHKDGKQKTYYVHRLVATAFIENDDIEHKTQVNHIDEDKTNNCVDNLEWITRLENVRHGTGIERRAKTQGKRVRCVETGVIYDTVRQAEKETGIANASICRCCKGKQKTCGGYHWQYVEKGE